MSLRDLCDAAYVMRVELLERRAVALVAAGAKLDPDELRDELDRELAEPPAVTTLSGRALALTRAMG